jgi:oligoendopeptidase F
VYQYATSMAASSYFGQQILAGQPGLRDTYLNVLRAGGSASAYELLKNAGVDLASPVPYQAMVQRMNALMDEMERLLAQKG